MNKNIILVNKALSKFGYKNVDVNRMAKFLKFSKEELTYIPLFWETTFNKKFIPLNRDLVSSWLCKNDKSESNIRKFYKRHLFKYEEGVDYVEIKKDDPIIKNTKIYFCHFRSVKKLTNEEVIIATL